MEVSRRIRKILLWVVVIIFFILPLKWVGSHTGLGCLMGGVFGYTLSNTWCYVWSLFEGLFLWPFQDIWSEVGMQMIMTTYLLWGAGAILVFLILKNLKIKE